MSETKYGFTIADDGTTSKVKTQYGMRYPDGTIKWKQVPVRPDQTSPSDRQILFSALAEGDSLTRDYWERNAKMRAESANLDLDTYLDQHQLVKRTVFIGTSEPENV